MTTRVILVTKSGAQIPADIENVAVRVLIRQDTRLNPPVRVFRHNNYLSRMGVGHFEEVDCAFIETVGDEI